MPRTFLSIPQEVRDLIYGICFHKTRLELDGRQNSSSSTCHFRTLSRQPNSGLPLMTTCKQVYAECMEYLGHEKRLSIPFHNPDIVLKWSRIQSIVPPVLRTSLKAIRIDIHRSYNIPHLPPGQNSLWQQPTALAFLQSWSGLKHLSLRDTAMRKPPSPIATHAKQARELLGNGTTGCEPGSTWRASVDADAVAWAKRYEDILRFCHGNGTNVELRIDAVVRHTKACCSSLAGRVEMHFIMALKAGESFQEPLVQASRFRRSEHRQLMPWEQF